MINLCVFYLAIIVSAFPERNLNLNQTQNQDVRDNGEAVTIQQVASKEIKATEMSSHPCQEVFNECTTLRCPYGVEAYVDNNDCNRCKCHEPCSGVECLEDEYCGIGVRRNKNSNLNTDFIAICVKIQAPQVDTQTFKSHISGLIGDQAVLKCAVTGNPYPKIKWSKENIEINGTQPRYRIKLDQSLQIITLHKTDSGIYLCTADNGVGEPIKKQVKLNVVVDFKSRPATILGQHEDSTVVVLLNSSATINCFALGHPFPAVTWWKDDSLIPLTRNAPGYSLVIYPVKLHNLGIYTCQAYNGIGKAASWTVTVKAKGPYRFTGLDELKYKQYIVNPPEVPVITSSNKTTTTTTITTSTTVVELSDEKGQEPQPLPDDQEAVVLPTYLVPVSAQITIKNQNYPVGSDIQIPCEVSGYPHPQIQWYKDGLPVNVSDRIQLYDSNILTILQAIKADSGYYLCKATNAYDNASSTLEILIGGMVSHSNCTDHLLFANCAIIIKAKYCSHKYYATFCCQSCAAAGLLIADGPH